jgi:nucleoside-diphosphate-sugar epimerase
MHDLPGVRTVKVDAGIVREPEPSDPKEINMRIFMTGATGFIGSYLVPELIDTGHHVLGLSRSDAGADRLTRVGAEVIRGDLSDLHRLRSAAESADGVTHTAFNHDFSNLRQHSEEDRKVIETLGEALLGSNRPLLVASACRENGRPIRIRSKASTSNVLSRTTSGAHSVQPLAMSVRTRLWM